MREHFSRFLGPVIYKILGLRCTSFGYQYSEIVETIEKHSEHFYTRANNCSSQYNCLLALRGWQREEIGRHRAWVEFHPYGEVGGQGMPSCHTAATACGWQSGLVGGRIHVSLHSDQRLYINQPRGCGVL